MQAGIVPHPVWAFHEVATYSPSTTYRSISTALNPGITESMYSVTFSRPTILLGDRGGDSERKPKANQAMAVLSSRLFGMFR